MKKTVIFYVCGDEYETQTYFPDSLIESFKRHGIKAKVV